MIQIIGLKNIKYDETTINTLRYRHVLIATDYDVDGYHICGLFINFIHRFWPELIGLDFLQRFTTPIVIGYDGKKEVEFFSESNVHDYKGKLTNVTYYKGLGSFDYEKAKQLGINFAKYIKPIYPKTDEYDKLIE